MAVANYQEAQTYLKFLPLLHDLPKQPFFIVYDAEADVLYILSATSCNQLIHTYRSYAPRGNAALGALRPNPRKRRSNNSRKTTQAAYRRISTSAPLAIASSARSSSLPVTSSLR